MDPLSRMLLTASGGFATSVEYIANTTAVATQTNSNTSITLTGIQSGDIVFFTHCADENMTTALESSWTTTEGSIWSALPGGDSNSGIPAIKTYWKEATGTSISVDTGYTPTSASFEYGMSLTAFRGVNTTSPVHFVGNVGDTGGNVDIADFTTNTPNFNSYLFSIAAFDDDINVTMTPPASYTKISQQHANTSADDNGTQASAYSPYSAGTSRTGEWWTTNGNDRSESFLWLLIPENEDGVPVITGNTNPQALAGGTAVATYTADNTVTWSLGGTDASLFSISSGGVVTYDSASVLGRYYITVTATNSNGFASSLSVTVDAYENSGGSAGGGITYINAVSNDVQAGGSRSLNLSGLQSGDVVYFIGASDNESGNDRLSESGSWSGWSNNALLGSNSPYIFYRTKIASGSSESVTLSVSGTTVSHACAVALFAFRGVDNTDPVLANGAITVDNSSTITVASDFMLTDTVRIIYGGLDDDEDESTTSPSGYTEIVDQNSRPGGISTVNGATLAVAYKAVTGNTTESAVSFTFTASDSCTSGSWQYRPD